MNKETVFKVSGLGTEWVFTIFDEISSREERNIRQAVASRIKEFEGIYTRFKESSLISELNRFKKIKNPPAEMIDIFTIAKSAFEKSNGRFNIAIGNLMDKIGYDSKISLKYNEKALFTNRTFDDSVIALNISSIEIAQDVKIDLGGLGKGYLIDLLIEKLRDEFSLNDFIVNGGGDLKVFSTTAKAQEIYLENPFDPDFLFATVMLSNSSLGVSSKNRRNWDAIVDGVPTKLHHIVDPVSGGNPGKIFSVYTICEKAVDADIVSTSIFASDINNLKKVASNFGAQYLVFLEDGSYSFSEGFNHKILH